jgi:C4-dicarboxylate transporter DctM subunit
MPLYILTGDLISEGGISRLMVAFARSVVGWLRGGLALTAMLAAEGFAAISGSNSATVAAIGRVMVPEMRKDGYPIDFAAGTIACCGTVGIVTPPSIVFVIYGVTAGVSVGDLFLGGIIPGLVMIICMSVAAFALSIHYGYGGSVPFRVRTLLRAAWDAKLAFIATAIILGGIYGGIFTPTEAAAVAVAYCLLAGIAGTGQLHVRQLPKVMDQSASITGLIAPIIAIAIVFSEILAVLGLPQAGVKWLLSFSADPALTMGIILLILFIAGCVMDAIPNTLILTPLLAPVAAGLGYHPVHFGVIMVVSLAIGFATPPFGLNLFVASSITGVPYLRIAMRAVPYVISLLLGLLVITLFPYLSLLFVPVR